MATEAKRGFWQKCRVCFRWTRISLWLVILGLLGALVYLNQIGLPDFLKRPLLARLQEEGVALEFRRLYLHWTHGFVADQVRFGAATEAAAPHLLAQEARIKLSLRALLRGQVQVEALGVQDGRLEWRPTATNEVLRALTVENIQAQLRFLPNNQWRLDDLRARFAGADFRVTANLTNAAAIRDWDFLKGQPGAPSTGPSRWPARLQKLADTLAAITFKTPPEITLVIEGDARVLSSFAFRLNITAPEAKTPWGDFAQVEFDSRLFAAGTNDFGRADINLVAARARTPWATTTNLDLQLRLQALTPLSERVAAALTLRAAGAATPWATAVRPQLKANWIHLTTNAVPESGRIELSAASAATRWAQGSGLDLSLVLSPATNPPVAEVAPGWITNLWPYQLAWSCRARAAKAREFLAENLVSEGRWAAPELSIAKLYADLYRGGCDVAGTLDVGTREVNFTTALDFDVKPLVVLLPLPAQQWFDQFSWSRAPQIRCAGALVLPAATNAPADWLPQLLPTLRLAGELSATRSAFREVAVDSLRSRFTCTNLVWRLPDFELASPAGGLRFDHIGNATTHEFYFRLHSTLTPEFVRPLLSARELELVNLAQFGAAPVIEGELWGNWSDWERIGFRGRLALTNSSLRGQFADAAVAAVNYTNRVAEFLGLRVWSGAQTLMADAVVADFNALRVYFTNGLATADPRFVTRAIGPMVDRVMTPYHFLSPPTATVNGYAPMRNPHDADLRFEGGGGPFECLKFKVPRVDGLVHWHDDHLILTNLVTDGYGGRTVGWAQFTFGDHGGAEFTFGAAATNVNLRALMTDLGSATNSALEGVLDGQFTVTDAHTGRTDSWNGFGQAALRDGLIWSIPIFGVLSQPLDAVMPGVGRSRISNVGATFVLTNSVLYSEDLEMRGPTMRLQYRGTADFAGNVNARVTAEPLRDTPIVGPVVNLALWPVTKLFEYKITGTLANPKSEPLYVPARVLLMPLRPFRTLEELFPAALGTNAPARQP